MQRKVDWKLRTAIFTRKNKIAKLMLTKEREIGEWVCLENCGLVHLHKEYMPNRAS